MPPFAPLAQLARAIGIRGFIAIGMAVALAFVWWRWSATSDALADAREDLRAAQVEIATLKVDAALKEIAAAERQADTAAVAQAEKDLLDAIADIPDTVPDSVRVQLNCRRLRAAGRLDADLPVQCRSGG